jgi:hypothetical protein
VFFGHASHCSPQEEMVGWIFSRALKIILTPFSVENHSEPFTLRPCVSQEDGHTEGFLE